MDVTARKRRAAAMEPVCVVAEDMPASEHPSMG